MKLHRAVRRHEQHRGAGRVEHGPQEALALGGRARVAHGAIEQGGGRLVLGQKVGGAGTHGEAVDFLVAHTRQQNGRHIDARAPRALHHFHARKRTEAEVAQKRVEGFGAQPF